MVSYIKESIPLKPFKKNRRDISIIQLSLGGDYIAEFLSVSEASRAVGLKFPSAITPCLLDINKTAKGYKWMYKTEYEKIKNLPKETIFTNEDLKKVGIIQLSLNGEFIREWESLVKASKFLGQADSSAISRVCRGKSKTSGGYKWMYKEDYEKLLQNNQ